MTEFRASRPFKPTPGTCGFAKTYATVDADIDLMDQGPQANNTPPKKIIVWGGGVVVFQLAGGVTVTTPDLPEGAVLEDFSPVGIVDSGTTATDIMVFWS